MKKQFRVKTHEDFQHVVRSGLVEKNRFFVVYYLESEFSYPRVGISAPIKLGNAVIRSKTRRQIRGMLQECWSELEAIDYVIIARKSYDLEQYGLGLEELKGLLNKIRRKRNEKKHKTAFKVLALVLGLFAVTGCTANFCSVNDKAHILYNYDAGLSYDEAGQPIIKDDVLQFKNEAVTKQMTSIAKNYDVPSKTFFVALDEKVKELAMDAYTKDANKVADLTTEEILKQYGYLKFAGQKENKKER